MIHITDHTLYHCWMNLNGRFLFDYVPEEAIIRGCDLALSAYRVQVTANSFMLPKTYMPLMNREKRIPLLWKRYIKSDYFNEDTARIREVYHKGKNKYPTVTALRFWRTGDDTPTGGGCLIAMTFVQHDKRLKVQVLSRASEITKAWLADLYFVQSVAYSVADRCAIPKEVMQQAQVDWNLTIAVQSRVQAPLYLAHLGLVDEYMREYPKHEWQAFLQKHFWSTFRYPEKNKFGMTKRVIELFYELTQQDWAMMSMPSHLR